MGKTFTLLHVALKATFSDTILLQAPPIIYKTKSYWDKIMSTKYFRVSLE